MDSLSWIIVVLIIVVGTHYTIKAYFDYKLKSQDKTIHALEQKLNENTVSNANNILNENYDHFDSDYKETETIVYDQEK